MAKRRYPVDSKYYKETMGWRDAHYPLFTAYYKEHGRAWGEKVLPFVLDAVEEKLSQQATMLAEIREIKEMLQQGQFTQVVAHAQSDVVGHDLNDFLEDG